MSAFFSREKYKHRYVVPRGQALNKYDLPMNRRLRMIQLRHYSIHSTLSFYDNQTESKWNIIRQRLPDILALSTTYKPTHIRAQLLLLIALMNRQTNELRRLSSADFNQDLNHIAANVVINIGNRNRIISLKRIPIGQMIHVDVDGLAFSIPTRQFIIAISQGYAQQTAAKFCPPAIGDMLINLSKKKLAYEGRQYKRALLKMRIGKMLFFSLFIFIIAMMLSLIIGTVTAILRIKSSDYLNDSLPMTPFTSSTATQEYTNLR